MTALHACTHIKGSLSAGLCLFGLGLVWMLSASIPASAAVRTWTSSTGTTVQAEYLGREQGRVKLRKTDGGTIEVPLNALSAADRSWVLMSEARGKKEESAPVFDPPDELSETLPVLRRGEEAGFHTYVEKRLYDAGLDDEGRLRIFLKENRSRIGEPLLVYMDCFTRDEKVPYMGLDVLGFYDIPDPDTRVDQLTLHGVLKREVPFRLTITFAENGVRFEAVNQDPPGLTPHTTLRIRVRVPGVPEAEEVKTASARGELLKGWRVVSRTREGDDRKYVYADHHESMGGLNRRIAIEAPVYGARRITFEAPQPRISWLVPNPLPGYRGMELWRGFTVSCTKNYGEPNPDPLNFEINIK